MKLSVASQGRAKAFMESKARPLERARYAFHFGGAGPAGVLQALAAFQNDDGGFGHGLEPDLCVSDSSAVATTLALQTLAQVSAPPENPMVGRAIRYLLARFDPQAEVWEVAPRTANDAPHAPWWHYDDHGQAERWGGYLLNPRAEILGCLYDYAALVPPDFLRRVSDSVMAHLEGLSGLKDMHEIRCCLTLAETPSLPDEFRRRLVSRLEAPVAQAVERDPAKWGKYCLKPAGYMAVVRSPASPFAKLLAKEVELNLDYEIQRQHADGSWLPTWSWGGSFPEAWEQAKLAWQGILTVRMLRLLAAFGRLEDGWE